MLSHIIYHRARKAKATGIIHVAWDCCEVQTGDLLTKLMIGPRLEELSEAIHHVTQLSWQQQNPWDFGWIW
jgi:hypothetical protein